MSQDVEMVKIKYSVNCIDALDDNDGVALLTLLDQKLVASLISQD